MSYDMKLIMENWRKTINEEKQAKEIYENLINEFVNEIKTLNENKAELNEVLSSIKNFAQKALNTYKTIKSGAIESVLTTAINSALKMLDLLEDKAPTIVGKLKAVLSTLKKSENMTMAVSIVSIIIGLMTGEAFDALGEVLDVIKAAPNILMAYEKITAIQDTADIGQVINKSGQLTKAGIDAAKG